LRYPRAKHEIISIKLTNRKQAYAWDFEIGKILKLLNEFKENN
jgi:hypothetical protein